ncbi:FxSxx-COOH system tetratricopeptide repeat protein [Micromonospora sp. NPDC048871]|uniref:FxSxx-COOH system tetratricopeptide repeat protein n=1 Tax=unclassified Micromonospora TaxID=2617518 RepID=UPI002E1011CF|nr:FxSxx-COOH system tetratricopeptide repeat protein [Micromonospora sp. NBC_01739]
MATTDQPGGPAAVGGGEPAAHCTIVSFVSPTSGNSGRSSAVANIAWILASNGKRVLAVDWCTKTPRVYDYLRSFRVDAVASAGVYGAELATLTSPHPDAPGHRPSALSGPPAPEQGMLYRYAIPGTSFGFALVGVSMEVDGLPKVDPVRARLLLRQAGYDYVLIDTPVDLTMPGVSYAAMLSDVAVVCIPPRRPALQQAADLADQLQRQATGGIRILAAPTLRDVSQPWYGEARDSARKAFAKLLDESTGAPNSAIEIVEVPEPTYDTYDDVLAVLADTPGEQSSLLSAYEQMASWISGGAVTRVAEVPERIRRRYRRGVLLERAESADEIHVLYEPAERPYADWIAGQLRRANVQVHPHALRGGAAPAYESDATVLALLSPGVVKALGAGLTAGTDIEVFGVLTDGQPPSHLDASRIIDLREVDAARAQPLLLSQLGLIAPTQPTGDLRSVPRYPAETDRRLRSNLPARNDSFVGRSDYLERLRDQLTDAGGPVTLTGGAGVGKSEIAREFAHRFAYDYDVVWWIPAQDRETVQTALGELAQEINVVDSVGAAEAAVAALSAPRGSIARWLLIYDNADDAEVLSGLLPRPGAGHILFTSRDDGSSNLPSPLEVAAFSGDESVTMLRRMLGISAADARTIAAAVDHLPLALRLATAWIRERTRTLELEGVPNLVAVSRSVEELLSGVSRPGVEEPTERIPGSRTSTVARVLDNTLATLRDTEFGALAIRVAEIAAYLSPEGIGLPLLRSTSMLVQLAAAAEADPEEMLLAAGEIDLVLAVGARFALFDIDWGRGAALRMHRAIQVLIRESIPEPERGERHRQVLHGLAGYAPTDPEADDRRYLPIFEELQRHLVPSGALTADDPRVRHWVVKQVRYLFYFGDSDAWQSAVRLAQQACDRWAAGGDFDQLTMRLFVQTANLHRVLGRPQEALRLDEQVLSEQRRRYGLRHFRTLIAGRGRGGDLRGLGRFEDALVEDQATLNGYFEVLGGDHPNTRMAINNLAISFHLTGDAREALRLAHQLFDRWMTLFGPEEPATWRASCLVGTLEREVGEYELSLTTLRGTLERVHELRTASQLDELQVNRSLAVTERRLGLTLAAKKRSIETFRGYRDRFGEDHPLTRSSLLSMAIDYYRAGDPGVAVEHAMRCLRGYERTLETGHPFTAVCSVDLGICHRGTGEYDHAIRDGERGMRTLRARLGDAHPWTLTAATAQAGHLAAHGDLADAVRLQQETHLTSLRFLGRGHPCTGDAAANLAAIIARRDGVDDLGVTALTDTDIDVPRS